MFLAPTTARAGPRAVGGPARLAHFWATTVPPLSVHSLALRVSVQP
jgi:hypothetical protein